MQNVIDNNRYTYKYSYIYIYMSMCTIDRYLGISIILSLIYLQSTIEQTIYWK